MKKPPLTREEHWRDRNVEFHSLVRGDDEPGSIKPEDVEHFIDKRTAQMFIGEIIDAYDSEKPVPPDAAVYLIDALRSLDTSGDNTETQRSLLNAFKLRERKVSEDKIEKDRKTLIRNISMRVAKIRGDTNEEIAETHGLSEGSAVGRILNKK